MGQFLCPFKFEVMTISYYNGDVNLHSVGHRRIAPPENGQLPYVVVIPSSKASSGSMQSIANLGIEDGNVTSHEPFVAIIDAVVSAVRYTRIGSSISVKGAVGGTVLTSEAGYWRMEADEKKKKGEDGEGDDTEETAADTVEDQVAQTNAEQAEERERQQRFEAAKALGASDEQAREAAEDDGFLDNSEEVLTEAQREERDRVIAAFGKSVLTKDKLASHADLFGSDDDQDEDDADNTSSSDDLPRRKKKRVAALSDSEDAASDASSVRLNLGKRNRSKKTKAPRGGNDSYEESSDGESDAPNDMEASPMPQPRRERELTLEDAMAEDDEEEEEHQKTPEPAAAPVSAAPTRTNSATTDAPRPAPLSELLGAMEKEKERKKAGSTVWTKVFGPDHKYKVRLYLETYLYSIPNPPVEEYFGDSGEFEVDELNIRIIDIFKHNNVAGVGIWIYVDDPLFDFQEAMYQSCNTQRLNYLQIAESIRTGKRPRNIGLPEPCFNNMAPVNTDTYSTIMVNCYMGAFGIPSNEFRAYTHGVPMPEYGFERLESVASTPVTAHNEDSMDDTDSRMGVSLGDTRRVFCVKHFQDPRLFGRILAALHVCDEQRAGREFDATRTYEIKDVEEKYFCPKNYLIWKCKFERFTMERLFTTYLPHYMEMDFTIIDVDGDRRVGHLGTIDRRPDLARRVVNLGGGTLRVSKLNVPADHVQIMHTYIALLQKPLATARFKRAEAYYAIKLTEEEKKSFDVAGVGGLTDAQRKVGIENCKDEIARFRLAWRKADLECKKLEAHAEAAFVLLLTSRNNQSDMATAMVEFLEPFFTGKGESLAYRELCMCIPPSDEECAKWGVQQGGVSEYERIMRMSAKELMMTFNAMVKEKKISKEDEKKVNDTIGRGDYPGVTRTILLKTCTNKKTSYGTRMSHFGNFVAMMVASLVSGTGIVDAHHLIAFIYMMMNSAMIPIDFRNAFAQEGSGGTGKSHSVEFAALMVPPGIVEKAGTISEKALGNMDPKKSEEGAEVYFEAPPEMMKMRTEQNSGSVAFISLLMGIGDGVIVRSKPNKRKRVDGSESTITEKTMMLFNKTLFMCMNQSIPDPAMRQRFYYLPTNVRETKNKRRMTTQVYHQPRTLDISHITKKTFRLSAAVGAVGRGQYIGLVPETDRSIPIIFNPHVVDRLLMLGLKNAEDPRDLLKDGNVYTTIVTHKAVWLMLCSELSKFHCDEETYKKYKRLAGSRNMRVSISDPEDPDLDENGTMLDPVKRRNTVWPDLIVLDVPTGKMVEREAVDEFGIPVIDTVTGEPIMEKVPEMKKLKTHFPRKPKQSTDKVFYLPVHPMDFCEAGRYLGPDYDAFIYVITNLFTRVFDYGMSVVTNAIFTHFCKCPLGVLRAWIRYNDDLMAALQHLPPADGSRRKTFDQTYQPDSYAWNIFTSVSSRSEIRRDLSYYIDFESTDDVFIGLPAAQNQGNNTVGMNNGQDDDQVEDMTMRNLQPNKIRVSDVPEESRYYIPQNPKSEHYVPPQDLKASMEKTFSSNYHAAMTFFPNKNPDGGLDGTYNLNYVCTNRNIKKIVENLTVVDGNEELLRTLRKMTPESLTAKLENLTHLSMNVPVLPSRANHVNNFSVLGYLLHPGVLESTGQGMRSMPLARKDAEGILYFNIFMVFQNVDFVTRFVFSKLMYENVYPHNTVTAVTTAEQPAAMRTMNVQPAKGQDVVYEDPDFVDERVRRMMAETMSMHKNTRDPYESAVHLTSKMTQHTEASKLRGAVIEIKDRDVIDVKYDEYCIKNGYTDSKGNPCEDFRPRNIDRAIRSCYEEGGAYEGFVQSSHFKYPKHFETLNGDRKQINKFIRPGK